MYTKLKFFYKKRIFYALNFDIIDIYFYIFKNALFYRRNLWNQVEVDSFISIGKWIGKDISKFCCENDIFLDESSPSFE